MNQDGITRLYCHSAHEVPTKVKESWPQHAGFDESAWVMGEEAEEIVANTDFVCVSVRVKKGQHYWVVIPSKDRENKFNANMVGNGLNFNEDHANLAQKLEEVACKKGLIVIIH